MTSDAINAGKTVVILGATSAMARATAIEFGRNGYDIILAARDEEENAIIADDLRVRCGVEVTPTTLDVLDFDRHPAFVEQCRETARGHIEGVVLCFGDMAAQEDAQRDFAVARRMIDVNYAAAVSLLESFARYLEERRRGFIAAIASVAGDRGRQSNYLYGSTKAALATYLGGLRNRLYHAGVSVTTIKPGFVDTKMTFGLPGLFLVAPPEKAGAAIYRATVKGKSVAYVPFFWQFIMLIIQHVPEWQFKRMHM